MASLATGLAAVALIILLGRTPLSAYASIIALVVPTILVLGVDSIARVEDIGEIPQGLPIPALPDLGLLTPQLVVSALAIAAIVLVQGAGVAESAPNRDGSPSNPDQDFIAQGVGNVASGVFRGLAVGGSVGQTALNVSAGAMDRWASIFSGIWMLVILVVFSGVVGVVAMPTLAAILIVAAIGSLRIGQIESILRTGPNSQIALVSTFLATLFLPVAAAVAFGVVLSLMLQLNQEAIDLRVMEWVPGPDYTFTEQPAPRSLESHHVTILNAYGSLFYAGARTLQARLPEIAVANRPVVILRMRGRVELGATAFKVLDDYAARLEAAEGRLYLTGIEPRVMSHFTRAGQFSAQGPIQLYEATPHIGESTMAALQDAEAWIVEHRAADDV